MAPVHSLARSHGSLTRMLRNCSLCLLARSLVRSRALGIVELFTNFEGVLNHCAKEVCQTSCHSAVIHTCHSDDDKNYNDDIDICFRLSTSPTGVADHSSTSAPHDSAKRRQQKIPRQPLVTNMITSYPNNKRFHANHWLQT